MLPSVAIFLLEPQQQGQSDGQTRPLEQPTTDDERLALEHGVRPGGVRTIAGRVSSLPPIKL